MGRPQQFNQEGPSPKIKKIIKLTGPPPVEVNPIRIAYLRHKKSSDLKLQSRMNAEVTEWTRSAQGHGFIPLTKEDIGGVAEYIIIHVIPVEW